MLVEPPTPLLPATLGGLHREADGDAGDGLGLVNAAGLSAQDIAVVSEDGLKRFAKSKYGNSNGKDFWAFVDVTVYRFGDASGAISAYEYFKKPGMRPEKLGDECGFKREGSARAQWSECRCTVLYKPDREAMLR